MGFWNALGKFSAKRKKLDEEELIRERERREYERPFRILLQHFEMDDLKNICRKVYGNEPSNYYTDQKTNETYAREMNRYVYEDFIIHRITYTQIKQFALKNRIVPLSFFPNDKDLTGHSDEFENIINAIHRGFEPEKITNEEHLEAQLTIFLKAKFPHMKVERQQYTKKGEKLDIVVADKYVFELKVPKNRTHLRDLTAQLEEYKEQYPNLCAIIADISKQELYPGETPVETNLSQDIKEYKDRYRIKLNVPTLIFEIGKRK